MFSSDRSIEPSVFEIVSCLMKYCFLIQELIENVKEKIM